MTTANSKYDLNRNRFARVICFVLMLFINTEVLADQDYGRSIAIKIKSQSLSTALIELASQFEVQIISKNKDTHHLTSNKLTGNYSLQQALNELLAGSELTHVELNERTIAISLRTQEDKNTDLAKSKRKNNSLREGIGQVEEILVTSRKRPEKKYDIPAAILAIPSSEILDKGINGPQSLSDKALGLVYSESFTARASPRITLRGVGDDDFRPNGASSVSVHKNGVVLGSNALTDTPFFDLERIEVLKGPQGTLYGRNATAGTINIITKKPSDVAEGNININLANFNTLEVNGGIGGPISNRFRYRLAGLYERSGGFLTHLGTQQASGFSIQPDIILSTQELAPQGDFGGKERKALRLITELDINDFSSLTSELNVSEDDIELASPSFTAEDIATFQDQDLRFIDFSKDALSNFTNSLDGDPFSFASDIIPSLKADRVGLTLTLDQDLISDVSNKTILSYQSADRDYQTSDGLPIRALDTNFSDQFEQLTLESQFSTSIGNTDLLFGFFILDDDLQFSSNLEFFQTELFQTLISTDYEQTRQSQAVFGSSNSQITGKLNLEFGFRYTRDQTRFVGITRNLDPFNLSETATVPAPVSPNQPLVFDVDQTDDSLTWKINLSYQPNDNLHFYTSGSTGYKTGGFDGSTILRQSELQPIEAETVLAYEAGIKYRSNNSGITLDINGFIYDFDDYQSTALADIDGAQTNVRTNIGRARIFGLDVFGSALLPRNLRLSAGAAFLNSEISAFDGQSTGAANLVGNELPYSPEFSWRIELTSPFELFNRLPATASVSINHTDSLFVDIDNTSLINDYTLVNGRFSVPINDWSVTLFARNITNEEYFVGIQPLASSLPEQRLLGPPRTVGFNIRKSF